MNRAPSKTEFAVALIDALSIRYHNDDTHCRDRAVGKMQARQSAWWNSASYSNAAVGSLYSEANRLATLEDALTSVEDMSQMGRPFRTAEIFDRLIPLNAQAVEELSAAYLAIGTFRDRDELEARQFAGARVAA